MSMKETVNVSCPDCGMAAAVTIYNSVRANETSLKQEILEQQIFDYRCYNCKSISRLVYPLLYVDNKKRFAVWYLSEGNTPEMQDALDEFSIITGNIRKRVVYEVSQLVETILIFDSGLHDLFMYEYKILLQNKTGIPAENFVFEQAHSLSTNETQVTFVIPAERRRATISVPNANVAVHQWCQLEEDLDWINVNTENFFKIYKQFIARFG